ncbi:MAG TPA: BlaI/MecI/CopY family transcriptional regulator [Pseudonocardiaceae bacterium]
MGGSRAHRRAHGELETEVAIAVAAARQPVTVHDIQQTVDVELSHTAVHTILNRLVAKGLITKERTNRGHIYQPAQDAAEVVARQMDLLLRRGPSRTAVLQSFLSTLTDQDESQLRAWLEDRRERRADTRKRPRSR